MRLDLLRERPELAALRPLAEHDLARLCAGYADLYRAAGDARMADGYEHLGQSFGAADARPPPGDPRPPGRHPGRAQRLQEVAA